MERVFVTEFANSTTRQALFEQYRAYTDRLLTLLPGGFTQWIDGSFVSRKRDPNDIDVLTFVDADLYSQHEREIDELKQAYRMQRPMLVDAYFVRVYPVGHRLRFDFESNRVEWLFDWTRTVGRKPRHKGLIELDF
ncbi:hypothetical protein AWR27_24250 [Spirosoma montaniterrae]|uniref:Polymerase nucleotidyl transferase domain-containing protein n=1 Tax=Spirosoma montaniterrae TaxID=1178516 RepID=A0A1P9X3E0_9BACT|nr:hypothetical protein AWR27_24250 [Spirosoma montaniterrae]